MAKQYKKESNKIYTEKVTMYIRLSLCLKSYLDGQYTAAPESPCWETLNDAGMKLALSNNRGRCLVD